MVDSSSPTIEMRLRDAIEAVYQTFAAAAPTAIEGCPCCIDTRNIDTLLSNPLRQLSGQALWRYVSGAFYTIGGVEDFRYLLPRILEVSATDADNANDPEIVLNKLRLANWSSWSAHERQVIEQFVDAWFEQELAADLANVEDGWIGGSAEEILCGAACAGLTLSPWLTRLSDPEMAPVLNDMKRRFPENLSPFWEDAPDGIGALSAIL